MGELKLTPPRAKLLQAIADGAVVQRVDGNSYIDRIGAGWGRDPCGSRLNKVTARVEELRNADWVRLAPYVEWPLHAVGHRPRRKTTVEPRLSPQWFAKNAPLAQRDWELTDAGRAVLEAHRG